MNKLMQATYLINLAQVSNMLLTALAVPLMIGAEHYGRYAAIFAVPAFLQSTIEAFAVLSLHAGPARTVFWKIYGGLSSGALLTSWLIYQLTFGSAEALWAVGLGAALLFKSLCIALVYTDERIDYVKISIFAEMISFACYALVLYVTYARGDLSYTVPLLMVITGSTLSGCLVLRWYVQAVRIAKTSRSTEQDPPAELSLRMLLSRSYEDFALTLMPLFLAQSFGLVVAGEFRVIVSGMKVVSKLFPFRYETILRGIRAGEFDATLFSKISLAFIGVGFIVSLLLYLIRGHLFLAEDTPLWSIALSTGFLVTSLAAFPVATIYSPVGLAVSTIGAAMTCLSIWLGSLTGFIGMFITLTVVTYVGTVQTLLRYAKTQLVNAPENSDHRDIPPDKANGL